MHIHILGICGTFMGGLARLAREAGHRVSGCDAETYPPMSDQLREAGIELIEGYDPKQTGLNPDVFIIGNAISRGNPLLEAILDAGLPYQSGPQWLAEHVLQGRWALGVAGTHGKTTTASMLTWILESAGLCPGFLIGGVPNNFSVSARLGDSVSGGKSLSNKPFFVIEADEYDTAFCDKRSKFIHYRPKTLILNNLEFDHADIFSDLAAIERQFHHLVRTLPSSGLIVCNHDEESLARVLAQGHWTPVEYFGSADSFYLQGDDSDGSLVLRDRGAEIARTRWTMSGEYNRRNAAAALLAARHAGVPLAEGLAALTHFQGVKRRMEIRGEVAGIKVYDDFAHHPTAIEATLSGLRRKVGKARILAVLEPRSNTMKLGVMKDRLAASLEDADQVFCYAANLGWDAKAALASLGERATIDNALDDLVTAVAAAARAGDHILVMSNGGFGGIHERLLAALKSGNP